MDERYYVVERIDGDYAFLQRTDVREDELLCVARALLPEGGAVWFKTDNEPLFDWSLESFRGCGWTLADMPEGTPMTDYEARFTEMGLPIHRVVATRP